MFLPLDGDVPVRPLPQDGGAVLHREEQVQAGPRLQEENNFLCRNHPGNIYNQVVDIYDD